MEVAEAITIFFVGAIVLAPVGAISARFAMKPILALLGRRLATEDLAGQVSDQARRIEALEGELAEMQEAVRTLTATADFERQLSAPEAAIGPKAPPAS
jgi:hypothetical protein